jgi:hypothetical protein
VPAVLLGLVRYILIPSLLPLVLLSPNQIRPDPVVVSPLR